MEEEAPTASTPVPFNGGKMNHIFTCDKGFYKDTFTCEAARRCFEHSTTASLKVHGECSMLFKKATDAGKFEWIFTTRRDTRGKQFPDTAVRVPSGIQPAEFKQHTYCFLPLDKNTVVGKGGKKSFQGPETYASIAKGVKEGLLPDPNDPNCPDFFSVEWVGKKHQNNIDNVLADHALYVHGSTVIDDLPRTRQEAELMAQTVSIEGLVYYDTETGERFKLLFQMFPESLFKKKCNEPVTADTTTIKPIVIIA